MSDVERANEFSASLIPWIDRVFCLDNPCEAAEIVNESGIESRLAALLAAVRAEATEAEKERCAKVCDEISSFADGANNAELSRRFDIDNGNGSRRNVAVHVARECAAAIRGQK